MAMEFDFQHWSTGGKVVFIASCVAVVSLLLPWIDVGIATRAGLTQVSILLLGFYVYPMLMLLQKQPIHKGAGIACGALAIVGTLWWILHYRADVFGQTIDASGIGSKIFLLASIALTVGVVMMVKDQEAAAPPPAAGDAPPPAVD